ncbi:hypothetical protein [Coleofasciculus sp. G2-EDA-02]
MQRLYQMMRPNRYGDCYKSTPTFIDQINPLLSSPSSPLHPPFLG